MFLIRADGNAKIGAGHVMRCLTIAEELSGLRGREDICFVCAGEDSAKLVRERGFRVHVLGTDYRQMESELQVWHRHLPEVCKQGTEEKHIILVDSYFVTDRYLKALRIWGYVVLMDDVAGRSYPVDCVINYNASADPKHYSQMYQGEKVRLLIGSTYIPVRRQFRNRNYQIRDEVQSVLITTGGGDSDNITGQILERLYNKSMLFYLVIGRFNPHFQELKGLEERCGNVRVCYDVKDMAKLMEKCDIAVTAGGSTVYELAAVGVPFICFSYAENQETLTDYIRENGVAGEAGAWHRNPKNTLMQMEKLFWELVKNREKRTAASLWEQSMVDCRGALRLAEALDKWEKDGC